MTLVVSRESYRKSIPADTGPSDDASSLSGSSVYFTADERDDDNSLISAKSKGGTDGGKCSLSLATVHADITVSGNDCSSILRSKRGVGWNYERHTSCDCSLRVGGLQIAQATS